MKAIAVLTVLVGISSQAMGGQLFIGAATTDITPEKPVALRGSFHKRISTKVESPLTANAVAIETRDGDRSIDQAVIVSCDTISIPTDLLALVREEVGKRVSKLDTQKIFLAGTHTHTAPELMLGRWGLPEEGVMPIEDYRTFFVQQVAEVIERAWKARKPGSVAWGLSHAVVAQNRRAVYADGSAQMYGKTNGPEFRGMEGYEDHDIGTMFFWNGGDKPTAVIVNVSCPSQEVESHRAVNADFWHPVRVALKERFGEACCVVGLCGAAGDQSPHLMYRKAAEERMRKLRGLDRLDEIARRIVTAVDDAYGAVKDDRHNDVLLIHKVETLVLPKRLVTEAEYADAKATVKSAKAKLKDNPKANDQDIRRAKWYQTTVDRFEKQKTEPNPVTEMELHVVRIGDAVICTNQFELFTDFGIRIKGRSKAEQTFVVQLVGPGTYLPTARAVRGGHYSAVVHSSHVGPKGGQVLVDRTVELIDSLWAAGK